MSLKNFLQSQNSTRVIYGIVAVVLALLIFHAGMYVGYHKAAFSYSWGDNYRRTFGERRGGMMRPFQYDDVPTAHGAIGTIEKIDLPTFVLEGTDNVEKIIRVATSTAIKRFRDTIAATDLKLQDTVVVIGAPNAQAEIVAQIIRLLPPQSRTGVTTQ